MEDGATHPLCLIGWFGFGKGNQELISTCKMSTDVSSLDAEQEGRLSNGGERGEGDDVSLSWITETGKKNGRSCLCVAIASLGMAECEWYNSTIYACMLYVRDKQGLIQVVRAYEEVA